MAHIGHTRHNLPPFTLKSVRRSKMSISIILMSDCDKGVGKYDDGDDDDDDDDVQDCCLAQIVELLTAVRTQAERENVLIELKDILRHKKYK